MFKIIRHTSIPSTHLWALENLSDLKQSPHAIFASHQTAGIGRKKNPWLDTPNENLIATFIFPLSEERFAPATAQLLSYSALQMLEDLDFSPLFKWPNDLFLSNKKVAGTMGEIKENHAIVSIGLNVNMPQEKLNLIDISATSLLTEAHHPFDLHNLEASLVEKLSINLTLFQQKGITPFTQEITKRLAYKDKQVAINGLEGTLIGLQEDGRLILQVDGTSHLIASGSLKLLPVRNSMD